MKKLTYLAFGLIFVVGIATHHAHPATTVLYDDILDANVQNLPAQARWYNSSSASNITFDSTANTMTTVASSSYLNLAYFTSSGSPRTLGTGDSLTFSFSFTLGSVNNTADGFRMGVFNSGGNRVSNDGYSVGNDLFLGYTGYGFFDDFGYTGTSESNFVSRAASATNNGLMSNGASGVLGASTYSGASLSANTALPYNGSFTITNNGTSVTLTYVLNGVSHTYTDSAYKYTSFDTIAIQLVTVGSTITFSDLSVVYTTAIPEPQTYALFGAGLLFMSIMFLQRNKKAVHALQKI